MIQVERCNRRAGGDPWPIYRGLVKAAALILLAAAMARGATCVPAQSGNWSAAATWTACGGGIPQSGDTVQINTGSGGGATNKLGYTVTLDTDATVVSVLVDGACCYSGSTYPTLTDAAGGYTLTLTASGANAIIFRNKGKVLLKANASSLLTPTRIVATSVGSTFAAIAVTTASPFQGVETLELDGVEIDPGAAGECIKMSNAFGGQTYSMQHTYCSQGSKVFTQTSTGTPNTGIIRNNTWRGISAANAVTMVTGVGLIFTNNTDIDGTAAGRMLQVTSDVSGMVVEGNVMCGSGTTQRLLSVLSSFSPITVSPRFSYNVGCGSATVPGTNSWAGGCLGTASFPCLYDHNVFQYQWNGIAMGNYNTLSYNIGVQNAAGSGGQGCYIALSKTNLASSYDACLMESNNGNINFLAITGSALTITNMLAYGAVPDTGTSQCIAIGEGATGSGHEMTNVSVSNSITVNCSTGIGSNNPDNTFVTTGTGSVGVFNNSATGAARNYYANGVASFGLSHPSATYGDVESVPALVSTSRRIATCDAILGGVGTTANFFSEMAKRWNGTHQANYTPQALWACMAAPLVSQNVGYATAGFGGTFVGPYKPILIVGP